MANEDTKSVNQYPFLFDRKTPKIFAKLDYLLRSGVHIQREYPNPPELYRFLDQYYNDGLKDYYQTIFELPLTRAGNEFNQYYFIDLNSGERSKVSSDFKDYLKSEQILVGLLFFKMYWIDGNIELESVSSFVEVLNTEYEEEMQALRKLVTDTQSEKGTDTNDDKLENVIKKSFDKYNELGWLMWNNKETKNKFKMLPSFERLRNMYQPQIENIDELIKKSNDEK